MRALATIAALLVACGTLESLHAVAIHTDRAVVAGRGATPRSRCAAASSGFLAPQGVISTSCDASSSL